jgi:hypothetical protein
MIQKRLINAFIMFGLFFLSFSANASINPFKLLWGREASTEIIFAPFGYHLFDSPDQQYVFHREPGMVNDAQYLVSLHWKSVTIGTFTNSYHDQVEFVGLYRQIIYLKRFDLAYLVGAMTGYGENAQNNGGPALTHSIVAHDPGLIVGLDASVPITKKIAFHLIFPVDFRSVDFGVGYTFG